MSTIGFRRDIQGLRALAVSLVILSHFEIPPFTGGFIGVDVFFVISGYLITGILLNEVRQSGSLGLAKFYARRLRRLLPALLAMISVTLIAALQLLSSFEITDQTGSLAFAVTWTSNLYFALSQADYFDWLKSRDLFLHTWSLGVEEQFYLLWPILLLMLLRWGDARKVTFSILGLFVFTLVNCIYVSQDYARWAFYLFPMRIWQFCLGAMVYLRSQTRENELGGSAVTIGEGSLSAKLFSMAGLVLILASAIGFSSSLAYPGAWALLPSLGAGLLIGAATSPVNRLLGHPMAVWVGDRSYGIYLWHWPVLVLGVAWGIDQLPHGKLALILLVLLGAMASFSYIEYPLWKGRWSRLGHSATVISIALAVMFGAGTVGLHAKDRFIEQSIQADAKPLAARNDMPSIYAAGCDHWYTDAEVTPCVIANEKASTTVALIGDSVGAQWTSLLPALYPQARIVILTKSSCPIVDEPIFYPRIGAIYRVCEEWRKQAMSYLESLHPSVVFVGSSSTYDYSDQQWRDGSRRIFERLSRVTKQVFVIAGTPAMSFDGPGCLARTQNRLKLADRLCRANIGKSRIDAVTTLLSEEVGSLENVKVLDLNHLICPNRVCQALSRNGMIVFRDNQHLTDSYVRTLAMPVKKVLEKL